MTATQNQPFSSHFRAGGVEGGEGNTHYVNVCDKGLDRVSAMNGFIPCWLPK